jgi:hypothetical protein
MVFTRLPGRKAGPPGPTIHETTCDLELPGEYWLDFTEYVTAPATMHFAGAIAGFFRSDDALIF